MRPDTLTLIMLKIVLVADIAGIAVFVADYSRLTRFAWARNPIGRTIVLKDLYLLGVVTLTALSVFFQFSRLTSHVAAWIQIALLGLVAFEMFRRVFVFERIHRQRGRDSDAAGDGEGEKPDGP